MTTDKDAATADEVRAAMARKRKTQNDVAGELGLSRQAVSDRLRGRTPWTVSEIHQLARLLDVPACALVDPLAHPTHGAYQPALPTTGVAA